MRAIFLEVRQLERIKTAKVTSEVTRPLLLVPSIGRLWFFAGLPFFFYLCLYSVPFPIYYQLSPPQKKIKTLRITEQPIWA